MQGDDEETRGQSQHVSPPRPSSEASPGAILAWLECSAWRLRQMEADPSFDPELVAREAGQLERRLRSQVRSGLRDYAAEVADALGNAGVSVGYQWVDGIKPGAQIALVWVPGSPVGGNRVVLEWGPSGWVLRSSGLRLMPTETVFPSAAEIAQWVLGTVEGTAAGSAPAVTARAQWITSVLRSG